MLGFFKKIDRHGTLMGKMAEHVGVDLCDGLADGRLRAVAYREAVMRCTQCNHVEACQNWMQETVSAEAAPPYCCNRVMFAELKD